jgi:integrase
VTEFGKPFTAVGFGNWFRDRCDAASLPQCAAHGLRKLAATRLAGAGRSHEQIKAVTGHRSDSALAPYIKKANKTRLARQALDLQLRAEGEQELSNVADPVGQKVG